MGSEPKVQLEMFHEVGVVHVSQHRSEFDESSISLLSYLCIQMVIVLVGGQIVTFGAS